MRQWPQRIFTLLAKYNLELSEIPDSAPAKPDTTVKSDLGEREINVWKILLYSAVAELHFSQCLIIRGRTVIVGTTANIIATREMARYLVEAVTRLAKEAAATVPGPERRRYRHSFAEGCAYRVCDRLKQMQLEAQAGRMKAEDPNSLLPALADLYQTSKARVDDFIVSHFGKIQKSKHYIGGGYVNGYNAGDRVGLHRQVGRKEKRLIA